MPGALECADSDGVREHPSVVVEKYSPDQVTYAQRRLEDSLSWGRRLLIRRLGLAVPVLHGDLLREMFAEPEDGCARDEGNIMTSAGLLNLVSLLTGETGTAVNPLRPGPGTNAGATVMGVGSGTGPALISDTHLGGDGNAASAWYQAMDAGYPSVTIPATINGQSTFGPSQANSYIWSEWCYATGAGTVTAGPALAGVYATAGSVAMMNHKIPSPALGEKFAGAAWVFVNLIEFSLRLEHVYSVSLARALSDYLFVIVLGVILLIAGFLLGFYLLWVAGAILLVLGLVLWLMGSRGRAVGGRTRWY